MIVHQKIIKVTIIIAVFCFCAYSYILFKDKGIDKESLIEWSEQLMIAIGTSSLVAGVVSIVSYNRIKKEYYLKLGKDLRRLFDIVDDYLITLEVLENDAVYFEEYYNFRNDFLNYVIVSEKETISLTIKNGNELMEHLNEIYLIPRAMTYYSYKNVKKIELQYKKLCNNKNVTYKYRKLLDDELSKLNTYLFSLKKDNMFNKKALYFYEKAGASKETFGSIDDFETSYRDEFYN